MATVTVGCKLPNGLYLRAFRMVTRTEAVLGGGVREYQIAEPIGEPVKINGYAAPFGMAPDAPISGGYALTSGIDEDLWNSWLEANKDSDLVRNNLIFASGRADHAQGRGREQAALRSGLEPLDPNNLPKGIETANKKAA